MSLVEVEMGNKRAIAELTTHSEWGKIFDITPRISSSLSVFPGDQPFERNVVLDCAQGAGFTLSSIKSTVHLGAHTDAPCHYDAKGVGIEARSLEFYLGKTQVVQVNCAKGARILLKDWGCRQVLAPRVLFRTGSFPNPNQWNEDFNSLSAELIEFLSDKGVRLVGIDTPSIDPATEKVLQSHHMVFKKDMGILEGVVLEGVAEGIYQLIALPLPMVGADASPVRALLMEQRP